MDSLHRDISGTLRVISGYDEDEYSHLFFQSNDRLTDLFPKLDVYGKNVLTVLGSGDQALYFYKMGANCVDLFDINKLTFFYYYLRIWIIKYLNKSYPDYFPDESYNYAHNPKLPSLLQILFSLFAYFPQSSPCNRI